MKSSIRRQLVHLMSGTPLESFARNLYMYLFQRKNFETDRQTVAVMQRILTKTSNCVDIGCYRGEILQHMVRLASQGEIFAFEPTPYHHDFLKNKFPKVKIFQAALGQTEGTATFYFDPDYPARSGLAPDAGQSRSNALESIAVRVDRLDRLIPRNTAVDFIKIDVEGAEYDVISGGKEVIRGSRPVIVFEHGADGEEQGTAKSERLYALLCDDIGLNIYTMAGWLGHESALSKTAFFECVQNRRYVNFIASK